MLPCAFYSRPYSEPNACTLRDPTKKASIEVQVLMDWEGGISFLVGACFFFLFGWEGVSY